MERNHFLKFLPELRDSVERWWLHRVGVRISTPRDDSSLGSLQGAGRTEQDAQFWFYLCPLTVRYVTITEKFTLRV